MNLTITFMFDTGRLSYPDIIFLPYGLYIELLWFSLSIIDFDAAMDAAMKGEVVFEKKVTD